MDNKEKEDERILNEKIRNKLKLILFSIDKYRTKRNELNYTKIGRDVDINYQMVGCHIKGERSFTLLSVAKYIQNLHLSDAEILSLFKDSVADGGHKKELKQPELVKIPEPEPTQKYYGIIKKAYDMQDNNPEIKGKLSGVLTLIESIESDIKKIKSQKKENPGESKY